MKILKKNSKIGLLFVAISQLTLAADKPNIVFVITDDQGYGDLACNGHPYIKTPNIDELAAESVRLDDYHVFPTCSPSRAAIMTGHWANRTGVWHTINGRSLLRKNQVTIASMLKSSGYTTGIFGKWHLGDGYPFRPQDRGFDEVYIHGAGGVGQTPDVWNNAYFDGGYYHNGVIKPAKGFCTDVFFRQGTRFIEESIAKKKPFFAYISTNAPHGPLHCPQRYMDLYKGKSDKLAAFYGMITNVDDNVGKLRRKLKELGAEKNTIFIFTTDNGSATGSNEFNAGMRGAKNSAYDGGHRVPLFLHWPAAQMNAEKRIKTLTHAVDIAPTLLDLTGAAKAEGVQFDGVSIARLLKEGDVKDWKDRYLITDSQRVVDPIKWRKSAVMSQGWRLVNGKELYAIDVDPDQKNDLAKQLPERVLEMRASYEKWWSDIEPGFAESAAFIIGSPHAPEVTLTSHDWISKSTPPWNQEGVRRLTKWVSKIYEGYWSVDVEQTGRYEVTLRRWPKEADTAINLGMAPGKNVPGASKPYRATKGDALDIRSATIATDDTILTTFELDASKSAVVQNVELKAGPQKLKAYFTLADKKQVGVCYLTIRKLD
ncbi:MAG: arylsulfatase [Rubritalea sp.]|uniref:arylsulfatase n=1 Tax=Rubritalea sp. TaxID=2109375 RepID=UPI0032421388